MLDPIERIGKYASRGRKAFDADELIQVFFVRQLQLLGEAAFKIPSHFRKRNLEIPWASIQGMRQILMHEDFQIDRDLVWGVVQLDLPELKRKLQKIENETYQKKQPGLKPGKLKNR